MIIQGEPETEGLRADMSFTIPRDDVRAARAALDPIASELGMTVATDESMGKVSIVGAGMKTHPGRRGQGLHRPSATTTSTSR